MQITSSRAQLRPPLTTCICTTMNPVLAILASAIPVWLFSIPLFKLSAFMYRRTQVSWRHAVRAAALLIAVKLLVEILWAQVWWPALPRDALGLPLHLYVFVSPITAAAIAAVGAWWIGPRYLVSGSGHHAARTGAIVAVLTFVLGTLTDLGLKILAVWGLMV